MSNNVVETLVGTVVLVFAGLFLTYAYSTADVRGASDGYGLYAMFDRVDGLEIGSDVRMSGIKIGSVTDQALDTTTYQARIEFAIESSVLLPEDSSIKVASEGLLGGSYLAIEPGGSLDNLGDGDEIAFTQGSIDLMGLIGQAIFSVGGSEEE